MAFGAMPLSLAAVITASASGCSLPFSRPAAMARNSCSETPLTVVISVTTGRPSVIVPVLSMTTVSTDCAISSASPDLMRMPFSAPLPVPTMMATGVARPSAHGHEMTRMQMAIEKANSTLAPMASQTAPASTAIAMTAGTKTPAILSAMRAIGAFEALASSTRRMIWLIVVSSPTRSALKWMDPCLLIVAEVTLSPACFSTGIGSPVMADSSTLVVPESTTPSAGMRSPGRTMTSSPATSSSAGMTCSTPPRTTHACFGARSMSFSSALLVCPFARASRYLPTVIKVTIMPADSK